MNVLSFAVMSLGFGVLSDWYQVTTLQPAPVSAVLCWMSFGLCIYFALKSSHAQI